MAERAIKTITWSAQAMMIHANLHWPEHFSIDLWPFAMDYAVWLHNYLPDCDIGLVQMELVIGLHPNCTQLCRCHVSGCPAYVLNPTLQDGKKLPKWKPHSRTGQFLGFSDRHLSTVGLICIVTHRLVSQSLSVPGPCHSTYHLP